MRVDELATFLIEYGFKCNQTMNHFGLTNGRYDKIAKKLDKHQILTRDTNHGRVLNTISRAELIRQFREDFPLVFDDWVKQWVEKNGPYERYILDREHQEQKEREKLERVKKQTKKYQNDIAMAKDFQGSMILA